MVGESKRRVEDSRVKRVNRNGKEMLSDRRGWEKRNIKSYIKDFIRDLWMLGILLIVWIGFLIIFELLTL